ncbi:hypothetical protein NQZ68_007622 [Dissostichus eleginoides]|nr:hypothetical protein NQZ68_007622 [Dissostichus eleginoides]
MSPPTTVFHIQEHHFPLSPIPRRSSVTLRMSPSETPLDLFFSSLLALIASERSIRASPRRSAFCAPTRIT